LRPTTTEEVAKSWPIIEAVAAELQARRRLSFDEVKAIVAD